MPAKSKELKKVVLEYLKRHNTMTLATAHDNVPWAAAVFYANDGFTLYFISNPSICLHFHNIAHNPRVAITINKDYAFRSQSDWRKVKGIQIEGIAKMLTAEEEISQAVTIYTSKYPFTSAYLKSMSSLPRVMSFLNELAEKLKFAPQPSYAHSSSGQDDISVLSLPYLLDTRTPWSNGPYSLPP